MSHHGESISQRREVVLACCLIACILAPLATLGQHRSPLQGAMRDEVLERSVRTETSVLALDKRLNDMESLHIDAELRELKGSQKSILVQLERLERLQEQATAAATGDRPWLAILSLATVGIGGERIWYLRRRRHEHNEENGG